MSAVQTCPECGAQLPPGMTPWLCPKCLLDRVAEGEPSATVTHTEPAGKGPETLGAMEESLPRTLGNYELLERIGQGGMGIVYRARQVSLDRIVAVKVLGTLANKEYVHRFRTEAVAAGSLQHPNIVAVHEVGLWESQHYLVMDYVGGPTFAELIRDRPLPAARAAGYLRVIAEAVHFAHERGILHRDLKPSNVLLDAHDQPRVTDFGLAKRMESGLDLTLSGQVLGSPSYMPPEQASGQRGRVGRHSDVYALGAVLFHLLTGRPPFVSETLPDTLRQVLNEEPLSPRLLNPAVPVDLETICLKCLEKDPERRYATARELAEELERFGRDEPILARPISPTGRVWRWCRRKPRLAVLSATVLGLLLVVAIGSPLAVYRIAKQRLAAVEQTKLAELHAYAAHINSAQQYLRGGNLGRTRELLELAARHSPQTPDARGWEWAYLRDQSRGDVEFVLEKLSVGSKLAISPDGRFLAVPLRYGQVHLWDLSTRTLAGVLGEENDLAGTLVSFSPDSRSLVSRWVGPETNKFRIWDVEQHSVRLELITTNLVGPAVFVPGRQELITGLVVGPESVRTMALWDLETRQIKAAVATVGRGASLLSCYDFLFTPDASLLLSGGMDGTVVFRETRGLQTVGSFPAHEGGLSAIALSPDGHLLATAQAGNSTAIKLWDFDSALTTARDGAIPQPLALLEGHLSCPTSLSFSADGRLLASGSLDHTIRIWDVQSRKEQRKLQGHENHVFGVQFTPDGRLYSSGRDGLVCAWSLESPVRRTGPEHGASGLLSMSLSRSDQRLAVVRKDGTIATTDLALSTAPVLLPELGTDNLLATYSANGRLLFVAKRSGEILVRDTAKRQALGRLPGNAPAVFSQTSQDGQRVLVMDKANRTSVWRTADWRETVHWQVERADCCALSPDGSQFATAREKGLVSLWDTSTGKELGTLTHIKEDTTRLAFSPNGRWLAAASDAGPVTVWDRGSRQPVAVLSGHLLSTTALAFSPDGHRLATGSSDKDAVKLWDTGTWQELLTLEVPGGSLSELAFTCDGTRLLARTQSGDLLIWTAPVRTIAETPETLRGAPGK
jgi:eukaryotic-like serine/threonine-protein kinase